MKQFYYPIKEIIAEVQEKALYRSKLISQGEGAAPPDALLISDQDNQLVIDLLKTASDDVYGQLRSLMRPIDGEAHPYEFDENAKIVFSLYPKKNFDQNVLPVLYTAVKDYMVECALLGFYEDTGYAPGIELGERKRIKLTDKIREYRIATKKPIRKRYTMI